MAQVNPEPLQQNNRGDLYDFLKIQKQDLIKSGYFADVFKVRRKEDQKYFAAKIIKVENDFMDKKGKLSVDTEKEVLLNYKHPLILECVDIFDQELMLLGKKTCIISEYAELGDL